MFSGGEYTAGRVRHAKSHDARLRRPHGGATGTGSTGCCSTGRRWSRYRWQVRGNNLNNPNKLIISINQWSKSQYINDLNNLNKSIISVNLNKDPDIDGR